MPVGGNDTESSKENGKCCREIGKVSRVRECRNDRVPRRSGKTLLLHGNEHTHPGGAHRHGGSLWMRSRKGADPHRRGPTAFAVCRARGTAATRDRMPH